MANTSPILHFLAGTLAVDFANMPSAPAFPASQELSWEQLLAFLEHAGIVSGEQLRDLARLPQNDPRAASQLLRRAVRLRDGLRECFAALVQKRTPPAAAVEPVNDVLRITEGHDELALAGHEWRLVFRARESGLEWLLAAVARSAAELLAGESRKRLRRCANPACTLFFCDGSRTGRRRWCSMALCGNRHKVAEFARRHRKSA